MVTITTSYQQQFDPGTEIILSSDGPYNGSYVVQDSGVGGVIVVNPSLWRRVWWILQRGGQLVTGRLWAVHGILWDLYKGKA